MLIGFIIIIGLLLLDQITKLVIVAQVPYGANIDVIKGFFSITHRVNDGAAWSVFSGQMTVFYIITVVALVIFGYYFKDINFKTKKMYSIGISLLIAGTLGNFVDRIRIKGVIDFLDFNIFGYDFPVFNVADSALNVGLVLFMIAVFIHE